MKMAKRKILFLILAMLLFLVPDTVHAASVAGKTQTNAIELKCDKTTTKKFWKGTEDPLYFVISVPEQGVLKADVVAKELGCNINIKLTKADNLIYEESKLIKQNKKDKVTKGSFSSEYILPKGNYYIELTPSKKLNSAKKVSIKLHFTASKFDDVEINNSEDKAQTINPYEKNNSKKVYLNTLDVFEEPDVTDCYSVTLKKDGKLTVKINSKSNMENVKLLVREKTEDTYTTIKAYDIINGKLKESIKLTKGTYYLKVWYSGDGLKCQMPYTISVNV